ncbi:hypothetical protein [Pseudokineococcus sp. 1T1Z-3]|uniref:hypothetical protein n=1 Tax=Pseudokineococcus sp. 1T1Z-3 TaxID=3132745 RepID=UPI003099F3C1
MAGGDSRRPADAVGGVGRRAYDRRALVVAPQEDPLVDARPARPGAHRRGSATTPLAQEA